MTKRPDLDEKRRKAQEAFLSAPTNPEERQRSNIQKVVPVEGPKEPTVKATFNLPVSLVEELETALAPRGKLRNTYRTKTDAVIDGLRRLLAEGDTEK